MRVKSLGQQSHEDSDQERASDIDDESAQRKAPAVFRHDPGAGHVAGQAAEPGARQDHQVFVQPSTSPFVL